jgi:pimeloyl-ACP methyl ester carboxylesterase
VVRGEGDEVGLAQEDRERLEQAPNVQLKTIEDARHFSMLDAPGALAALIVEQLRSAARSATS